MSIKVFGIDFTNDGLKIAVIEKQFRNHNVAKLVSRPLEMKAPGEIGATIKEALDRLDYDNETDQVIAVYPGELLTSRALNIPLTKRKMITETLPYEIEALVPFDSEDFICDYINIKQTNEGSDILAVIAIKEDFERFLEIYSLAGIDPDMVVPEPLTLAWAARYKPSPDGAVDIYLGLGADSISITVVKGATPVSFHVAPSGPADYTASVAREIKRQFLAQAQDEEELRLNKVIVSGADEKLEDRMSELESMVGAPVEGVSLPGAGAAVDSAKYMGRNESKTLFALALGAALIAVEGGEGSVVDLRTGEYKRKPRLAGYRSQFITAAGLLMAGILIWAASFINQGIELNREYRSLKAEIRSEFKKALPEVKKIVSETQQLKNALDKIKVKARALGAGTGGRVPFLDFLKDITLSTPKNAKLDLEELVYESESMIIAGRIDSFKKIDELKKNIDGLEWTGKVNVEQAKSDVTSGNVTFRIEMEIVI